MAAVVKQHLEGHMFLIPDLDETLHLLVGHIWFLTCANSWNPNIHFC